jgi:hypothetical protein
VVYSIGLGGRWLQLKFKLKSPEPGVPKLATESPDLESLMV